uniref:Uncharacterized protein n=1 Tax=Acrobeloides nanus TaxID=290746 RepID=A0A914CEL6_9BILA
MALEAMNKAIKEYDEEQKIITECCVKFASFLKVNAILPFNDTIKDYIQMNINEEEKIAAITKDYTQVESLREQLRIYEKERSILESNLESGGAAPITPKDIKNLENKLIKLHHFGKSIKDLFEKTKKGREKQFM